MTEFLGYHTHFSNKEFRSTIPKSRVAENSFSCFPLKFFNLQLLSFIRLFMKENLPFLLIEPHQLLGISR